MSVWDFKGYGEVYAADGCYVTRYEEGRVVEYWGPYESERKSENARMRIRRGEANRLDNKLHNVGSMPGLTDEE